MARRSRSAARGTGGGPRPARLRGAARRCRQDRRGGAVSLFVVLMVPVAIFAAVVAMAAPQRMRAESSMDEAAADLAKLAAAWRHGEQTAQGPLEGFPPECAAGDAYVAARCVTLFAALAGDLGSMGVDVASLRGYYSDAVTLSTLDPEQSLPCGIGEKDAYRAVVLDATHVALVADWREAGWAAAQVWPDGLRMGAESVGRLTVAVNPEDSPPVPPCRPAGDPGSRLDVSDASGRSLRLEPSTDPLRRGQAQELLRSVPTRTPFGG